MSFLAEIFVIAFLYLDVFREPVDVNDECKMYFALKLVLSGGFGVYQF